MKKILSIAVTLILLLAACEPYEDYTFEKFTFSSVYFPHQHLPRTAVSDEGLSIKVGVYLGGLRNNPQDQEIKFNVLDTIPGLVPYEVLPKDYYTLSNESTIIVKKGILQGFVDVTFNEEKFRNDPKCLGHNYALAFSITDAGSGIDSILLAELKSFDGSGAEVSDYVGSYAVIPIKYINTYEGNYYRVGVIKEFNIGSDTLLSITDFGDEYDNTQFPVKELVTISMDTVQILGVANSLNESHIMNLVISEDNSVEVVAIPGSKYQVVSNGNSSWDSEHRILDLRYKYILNGKEFKVEEKLTFRNRKRDGISEWRWPGFAGN